MRARVRYAKAGAFNIAYQVVGEGPLDLVLSPGWATHLDLGWEIPSLARFLEGLASFSRLILFDKRGTGLSDRFSPNELPSLEQRMDDVRAVMDAADSERAVLFGTLGGGAMCGMFAASYPERTDGLILYGTPAKARPDTGFLARLADSVEVALDRIERDWGTEISLAIWAPSLLADQAAADAYLRLERASMSPASARAMMAVGAQVDWRASLPAIRVPTLVLHREGDLAVPSAQGREVAAGIAGARYVELPGTDHLVWAGDQDRILEEVRRFVGALHPHVTSTRMPCTILMTDIVGSTEMVARLGDTAWADLLAEHHRVVRHELEMVQGREIDTAGDGFLAIFDGPARAVRCAQAIGRATAALGVPVRAGVHTGECEVSPQGIRGIAVHIAARVSALAGANEVLVTSTVRDLSLGSGLVFVDRGEHELKGVPGNWRLFATDVAADRG
jgi:class 3 adenylate cyclase